MQIIPRELLEQYKFCMACGKKAVHPYGLEIFNYGDEQFVYLRCTGCKKELRYEKPKQKEKITDKTPCKKCEGKVELKKSRHKGSKHLQKSYYFTHYYQCVRCNTMYMDNKFKVIN